MPQETDIEKLGERIRSGDVKAFEAFYDAYFAKLYRFLMAILKNPEDAEDVTSIAFTYVWNNRGKLRDSKQIVSWLYQVAKHRALDQLRKNKPNVSLEGFEDLIPETREPSKNMDQYFDGKVAEKFLENLSVEERSVVYLRFSESLTFSEIAEVLGSSSVTVRVRMHRIIKKLKKAAGENGSRKSHGTSITEGETIN